jgi:uncharacterized protein YndB with AHSA1/START domain
MSLAFLKSSAGDQTVVIEGIFKAPIARVYRAWTEPEEMMKWFGPSEEALLAVECDLRIGGRISFEYKTLENISSIIEGTYQTIDLNHKLVFSWSHIVTRPDGSQEATPPSKVTVIFEDLGFETKVRLTHENIVRQAGRDGVTQGWNATFQRLQALFDNGADLI